MNGQIAFLGTALGSGLATGAFIWLWQEHGAAVFLSMTESFLAWCM